MWHTQRKWRWMSLYTYLRRVGHNIFVVPLYKNNCVATTPHNSGNKNNFFKAKCAFVAKFLFFIGAKVVIRMTFKL